MKNPWLQYEIIKSDASLKELFAGCKGRIEVSETGGKTFVSASSKESADVMIRRLDENGVEYK